MIRTFSGYPEVSILNPRTRYFHQSVKRTIFEKMVLWILPICWTRLKFGYTQLFITSNHQNRPYRPIYQNVKKTYFEKKSSFLSKIGSRDVKTGPIGKRGQSQVRTNIPYKPANIIFRYGNMKFLLIFSLTILAELVTENTSKHFRFSHPKMIFVSL